MPLESIKKQNVGDMVFEQLFSSISSGEWKAGDRIPSENELTKILNVSRVSVRSALQRLSSLGIIETRRGEGSFVCELSATQHLNSMIPVLALSVTDRRHMFEFRKMVEVESAALAALRATPEQIRRLEEANRLMAEAREEETAAKMDLEFHRLLAEATQNPIILRVFDILRDFYLQLFHTNISIMGVSGTKQHQKIIGAVQARDGAAARALMEEHLLSSIRETGLEEAEEAK